MFAEAPSDSLKRIAESVLRLSDYYIAHPDAETPWRDEFCQIAYRNYYLPLNFVRFSHIIKRAKQVGFLDSLNHFIDWGCGPGTASLALAADEAIRRQVESQLLFDHSETVLNVFSDLHAKLVHPKKTSSLDLTRVGHTKTTGLIFSYSLTEVKELPMGWKNFEAIIIAEPSTSQDGRKLLETRANLIAEGYSIWAPCVHQNLCPLLTHSKHDWCHDRASVEAPDWFSDLEHLLPMRNRTVTTSYILARRTKPAAKPANLARTTGDSLEEKGKTRQLICRSEAREYLSWMHKNIDAQTIPRGELVNLPEDLEVKSNELRVKSNIEIID